MGTKPKDILRRAPVIKHIPLGKEALKKLQNIICDQMEKHAVILLGEEGARKYSKKEETFYDEI